MWNIYAPNTEKTVKGKFKQLLDGMKLLQPYVEEFYFNYVPNSFPNGTPDNPSQCYLNIMVKEDTPEDISKKILKIGGWIIEQDVYFLFY